MEKERKKERKSLGDVYGPSQTRSCAGNTPKVLQMCSQKSSHRIDSNEKKKRRGEEKKKTFSKASSLAVVVTVAVAFAGGGEGCEWG